MIPETYTEYTNYMLIQRIMCLEHQVADKMTPRDEFAKAAMTAIVATPSFVVSGADELAHLAYEMADAMLEARRGD